MTKLNWLLISWLWYKMIKILHITFCCLKFKLSKATLKWKQILNYNRGLKMFPSSINERKVFSYFQTSLSFNQFSCIFTYKTYLKEIWFWNAELKFPPSTNPSPRTIPASRTPSRTSRWRWRRCCPSWQSTCSARGWGSGFGRGQTRSSPCWGMD